MARKKQQVKKSGKPLQFIVPIFFLSILLLYLHNLTRDVYSGDIGDLVTAAYVHGVAHPPGYPLFTFLGFLLTRLPLPIPPVTKVALISSAASITALYLYYLLARRFSKNLFLSLLATAVLAFSYLFWFHAEIPEAFGLQNFFGIAIMFAAITYYLDRKETYLYLLAFLGGLSLTHHHTILFLIPAVLILLLKHLRHILTHPKILGIALLCFIGGLLPYLYVLLAARTAPLISWDNAVNLQNFLHLILRKDYGFVPKVVNEVPFTVKMIHVSAFLTSLILSYSYQILAVVLIGWISLFRRDKMLWAGLTVAFLLTGPAFIFYAASLTGVPVGIGIIERFYVLPSVLLILLLPTGFSTLKSFIESKLQRKVYSYLLLGYFLLIPFLLIMYNFPKTDLSHTTIGNTLADNIFSYLPNGAVLFVSGDTTTFNLWYNHYVLGKRPDIGLINPPGVGGNSYFDREINTYHRENPKTELKNLPLQTIKSLVAKKRVFATFPLPFIPEGTVLLPRGLVYEVVKKDTLPDKQAYLAQAEKNLSTLKISRKETLAPSDDNLVAAEIPGIYASGLVRIGDFVDSHYRDPARAENYYRRALWIDPDHPNAYSGLSLVLFKAYHDCSAADQNLRQAIALYPVWKTYYHQLYIISSRCKATGTALQNQRDTYQTLFHEDLGKLTAPYLNRKP